MVWLVGMIVAGGTAGLVALMRAERVRIHTSSAERIDAVSSGSAKG